MDHVYQKRPFKSLCFQREVTPTSEKIKTLTVKCLTKYFFVR